MLWLDSLGNEANLWSSFSEIVDGRFIQPIQNLNFKYVGRLWATAVIKAAVDGHINFIIFNYLKQILLKYDSTFHEVNPCLLYTSDAADE